MNIEILNKLKDDERQLYEEKWEIEKKITFVKDNMRNLFKEKQNEIEGKESKKYGTTFENYLNKWYLEGKAKGNIKTINVSDKEYEVKFVHTTGRPKDNYMSSKSEDIHATIQIEYDISIVVATIYNGNMYMSNYVIYDNAKIGNNKVKKILDEYSNLPKKYIVYFKALSEAILDYIPKNEYNNEWENLKKLRREYL